jgi:hypothetical protein
MGSKVFIDNNFSQGREFLIHFLDSPEFTLDILRKIMGSGSSNKKKLELAQDIAIAFEEGNLSFDQILLPYVKRSRQWLSFKLGKTKAIPKQKEAQLLLNEFGEDGWYGAIDDHQNKNHYYIRTSKITDYRGNNIRWTVIAKIDSDCIALSWNGFTLIPATDAPVERQVSFGCYKFIPKYFEEIADFCKAELTIPNLHKLILQDMWNKYLNNDEYRWHHLRIRAESSGVALNAHSSELKEINVEGLKALSSKLANSALEALGIIDNNDQQILTENAILRSLIKEWGTKSYGFSLEKEGLTKKSSYNKLIKAHCYFGLKPNFSTQDSLQHLKCDCGGSTEVLKFLLGELESYGNGNI